MYKRQESSRSAECFKRLLGQDAPVFLQPVWMEREKNALKGTITRLPAREAVSYTHLKPGRVMFEIAGVSEEVAREALRLASHKLPIKTKIIARTEEAGE